MFASYPVLGKHIAFNGRLLHGCPSSCALPRGPSVSKSTSKLKNKAATVGVGDQRVSLLVNIWLNHKPLGVEPISADPEEPAVPSPKQHSRRAAAAAWLSTAAGRHGHGLHHEEGKVEQRRVRT